MGVVPLRQAHDADKYGGKAAALARLMSNGILVPNGFCISSASASQPIRALVDEIQPQLAVLATEQVAVRSSASLEDRKTSSLAGLFRSQLDVSRTAPAIAKAVKKVFESAERPQVRELLNRLKVEAELHMAVIVQEMLKVTTSGVAFTRNPITGNPDLVIEFAEDSSTNVEAGRGLPHRMVLSRAEIDAARARLPWHSGEARQLEESLLAGLIDVALRCEGIFDGIPQDIEWAVCEQVVWVLQSRPITGLPSRTVGAATI